MLGLEVYFEDAACCPEQDTYLNAHAHCPQLHETWRFLQVHLLEVVVKHLMVVQFMVPQDCRVDDCVWVVNRRIHVAHQKTTRSQDFHQNDAPSKKFIDKSP